MIEQLKHAPAAVNEHFSRADIRTQLPIDKLGLQVAPPSWESLGRLSVLLDNISTSHVLHCPLVGMLHVPDMQGMLTCNQPKPFFEQPGQHGAANMQMLRPMVASPFQGDISPLRSALNPGHGTWPSTAQLGAELQMKLSSLNSNDSAACNFALLEPRVGTAYRTLYMCYCRKECHTDTSCKYLPV